MKKIQNEAEFLELCDWCTEREPKLDTVIREYGYPPFWHREPNFSTFILTILEQQVSLAVARTAFLKLQEKTEVVTPENLLRLNDEELRSCYFSRQKIVYSRLLASEITEQKLNLEELKTWSEEKIRQRLIQLKGIGHWTIDMYVLMCLHFADIFPPGDLATIKAVYELGLVPPDAGKPEINRYMERFAPYRSVATYILWHAYIEKRKLILE